MSLENEKAVLDTKLIHSGMLHKLAGNGGSIKLNNRFGVEIKYNQKNPTSPFVELSVFIIPIGNTFKGQINPSLARIQANKEKIEKAKKEEEEFELEEGEVIEG